MGFDVELPIRYFETSAMAAAFPASSRRLQDLTPDSLKVVELWPGRAAVAIMCFDYTQTAVGAYGEIGVCWPVVDSRRKAPPLLPLLLEKYWPRMGWWVHRLPVTTDIANFAGRTIWGYPKFVADIAFDWNDATRACTLSEGGDEILRLSIDTRMPAKPQKFDVVTYTVLGDELLTTRINVDAVGMRRMRRADAQLTLGPHPVGRELAELDLDLARPIETRWFPTWRAVLPEAERRRPIEGWTPIAAPATEPKAA